MTKTSRLEIHDLIDRISRISAAEHWVGDLNPAQLAALSYLSKANQYSRAPSQVSQYLCAMRGTVSATLKALARKGLIKEQKSENDRRRTSYSVTPEGQAALNLDTSIDAVLDKLDDRAANELANNLKDFVRMLLQMRSDRSFGICTTCHHHRSRPKGAHCSLLNVSLAPPETAQICAEHQSAA